MRLQFKFIAAFIAILILAGTGVVNAQNPDLSQNPVPDQATNPSEDQSATMDQAPSDQMSNDGNDQGGPDYQNDQQNERPPMSELPPAPKPSPSLRAPAPPQSSSQGNYTETAENSGAARLSLIHGNVSTQRGDSGDWSAAQLNAPLVTGDGVSTGDQARTELQLDYANLLRLAEHTQANITNLTRSRIQIQFGHGMGNYTVLRNSEAEAEIDTPNVAIRTNGREASFRILVTSDDHTEVLVRRGEVELTTPQGSTRVGENQFIVVKGLGDQTQYRMGEAPARDDWDQWNTDRDRIIRTSVSRRHTSTPTATGAMFPIMVPHGSRLKTPTGLPIAPDAGCGSRIGDGHGWTTNLGAGLRITMDAGSNTTGRGDGGRDRFMAHRTTVRFGRPLMFRSLDSVAASAWMLVSAGARSDGSRSDRVIASTPGGAAIAIAIT